MPYRSYEPDAPDPGSVDTRCPHCPAQDGECLPECVCADCQRHRASQRTAARVLRHLARRTA